MRGGRWCWGLSAEWNPTPAPMLHLFQWEDTTHTHNTRSEVSDPRVRIGGYGFYITFRILFLKDVVLINWKVRDTETKGQDREEGYLPTAGSLPGRHQQWALGQAKSKSQELQSSFPWGCSSPNTWAICCCFSQATFRKPAWKWSTRVSNRHQNGMLVPQVATLLAVPVSVPSP